MNVEPGLFGLINTNRDFTRKETWGKNQFNSSFPAALCCYMASKNMLANYLSISKGIFKHDLISIDNVFGISFNDEDTFFAFESQHTPYQKHVLGTLPRTDLVIQRKSTGECLSGLEVKLTALPDNTTCNLDEGLYGCEIVVRPDTIVYLACSIASGLSSSLNDLIPEIAIQDWTEAKYVLENIVEIVNAIAKISVVLEDKQRPFLLQPIWKTIGKVSVLAENCLDMFIWSDAGFCNFISKIAKGDTKAPYITRQTRTAVWLFKMLSDIKNKGHFDHKVIIDSLSYNTKNDKAFASAGNITNKYMKCERLVKPAILKNEIKEIILGGGQNLLSPERRFDAIIFSSPRLFE
ncbi:HindVP family restriction endonuclease [Legionella taurinensis]|uniref:HindVP family restriction endonuclease n=1 Tax=Legionella taurinensis TaxID=70611 RepID=A0A3A5L5D8_9GAMM|nr:HindVP family restriction endonuclease [Legionella taurinensis]RJT43510.1 HindVP family restriction endonuclease [Legionella taurinensis]RJT64454.1 HindVP family restriction endonuclease [Legionella taurinensis]STY25159.1 HindVP restriction endonuclease [Legionella taurinensis]